MANEFEMINACFKPLSEGLAAEECGIGDDGAVLNVPANHQLVVVTDTLVAGVHFPIDTKPYDIAWKALAVNLSDLAAMGAKPGFYSLALTLPENDQAWLNDFSKGLADLSHLHNIPLIGGDTTKGPLTVTVTAQGWVDQGKAVKRSGAKAGDLVCVTNSIGDGAVGLKVALNTLPAVLQQEFTQADLSYLLKALNRPEPQLALSDILAQYASSAIDVSDGLLADLGHILEMSSQQQQKLSAKIELDKVPISEQVEKYLQHTKDWSTVIAGGDDYQLCFTVSKEVVEEVQQLALNSGIKVTVVGQIDETDEGIRLFENGKAFDAEQMKGYLHF